MESNYAANKNPWVDDERTFGTIKNALLLGEKMGLLCTDYTLRVEQEDTEPQTDREDLVPSARMIQLLKDVNRKKRAIAKIDLDIKKRLSHRETMDLTQINILEQRINIVKSICDHIESVNSNKDQLISLLQKPFAGDFIRIEARYKQSASELFPQIVPILGEMASQLDAIEWASQVNFNDGEMDKPLSEITTSLAAMETSVRSLLLMRKTMQQLQQHRSDELLTGVGH